jgi:FlaA1/EpsC-like NDP-sugar epimerase
VSEATRLTAFAGAIGRPGEVLVLDMGAPIRIADVARRFARQYSPELQVIYTGLRSGEKMHESLFAEFEEDLRPFHPLVSHVPVEPLAISSLELECRGIHESTHVSNQLISLANS